MDEELLTYVDKVKQDLREDPSFNKLKELEEIMNTDPEIITLSRAMQEAQALYNEALEKEGEMGRGTKERQLVFVAAKNALYSHPVVKEYLDNYSKYRELLETINEEIFAPLKVNLCPKK
ncbi:MAG: YlbF family regulator [Coprobacillus sp.]|nr:YlbF family regulator [Coprobacillus sp.]